MGFNRAMFNIALAKVSDSFIENKLPASQQCYH
jgi:hypothetical protein